MKKIVVLGSLNMDMVLTTERLPVIGETIHGDHIHYMMGGKGSNQAVAASRMGISTSLIGCVGNDTFGEKILKHLSEEKLDISSVKSEKNIFTGIATVFKTKSDNAIVVIPGANECCDQRVVEENIEMINQADVLLTQLEIPMETVTFALKKAKEFGVQTIVNPAPYKELPTELFEFIDYITPNETEFESMVGRTIENPEHLEIEMLAWSKKYNVNLIVTRGSRGSSYIENGKVHTVPCIHVDVVDTTGAGDTFNGILAYAIAEEMKLQEAIMMAGAGASLSTTALGAQSGMPSIEELKRFL
ncbi:ribokinase [Neobacillus niacini]|uniref:ribokinase n=1 Tax=Neobacillus niacini TaxID=86668 RepID=UPI002FFFD0F8